MPEFMLSMPLTFCALEHICAQCSSLCLRYTGWHK